MGHGVAAAAVAAWHLGVSAHVKIHLKLNTLISPSKIIVAKQIFTNLLCTHNTQHTHMYKCTHVRCVNVNVINYAFKNNL